MSNPVFDELPLEQRDEMIADVITFLKERGYTIIAPGTDLNLETRDRDMRAQALNDAAEIVLNGQGRHQSPIQLAVKLKQMSDRVRAGNRR